MVSLRIQRELDQLTSISQIRQVKKLEDVVRTFESDFRTDPELNNFNDVELGHLLKVLKSTLEHEDYLRDSRISSEVIKERLLKYVPLSMCQGGSCQSCKLIEELVDSVLEIYRS
jgi:hypothetical protein